MRSKAEALSMAMQSQFDQMISSAKKTLGAPQSSFPPEVPQTHAAEPVLPTVTLYRWITFVVVMQV